MINGVAWCWETSVNMLDKNSTEAGTERDDFLLASIRRSMVNFILPIVTGWRQLVRR